MRMTEEIGALMTALAKAQGAMEDAGKDNINPHFKSRYATLASVRQAVRKPFAENGLVVMQFPRTGEGYVEVETILGHESGQWISDILRMPVPQFTPQGVGSVISYAKRYALMAIAAVASSDDDDDANAASTNGNGQVKTMTKPVAPPATIGKPALASVKTIDPATAIRTKARGMAQEGTKAFNAWYHTLSDADADAVDVLAEDLVEIAKAADEAELMRG